MRGATVTSVQWMPSWNYANMYGSEMEFAVWVGAGTIFPNFSELEARHILPNYGFGYRWEFKKRVNVRLDLGFGKHQTGFIFNINEAF